MPDGFAIVAAMRKVLRFVIKGLFPDYLTPGCVFITAGAITKLNQWAL
jgi:hypothetical protein